METPLTYVVVGDPDSAEAAVLRTGDGNFALTTLGDVPNLPILSPVVARHIDPSLLTDRFIPDTQDRTAIAALRKRLGFPLRTDSATDVHRFFVVKRAYCASATVGVGTMSDVALNQSGFVLSRFMDRENVSFRLWSVDIGYVNGSQVVVDVQDGNDMDLDLFPPQLFYTVLAARIAGSCCR